MSVFVSSVFVSWVEERGKVYFVTGKQLFSEKGQEWLKKHGVSNDDMSGHGTTRMWHGIDTGDGKDMECDDFSSPANFPGAIVTALKQGEFRGLGTPLALLNTQACAEFERIEKQAYEESERIKQPALAKFERIKQQAYAEYKRVQLQAYARFERIVKPALAEFEWIEKQAYAEFERIKQQAFWDIFAETKNRTEAWR